MNSQISASDARRNDLDWIRVIAVLLLVPFHSALIFDHSPYAVMYVKDSVDSHFLDCFAGWIHQFHMPILFFVAGAATCFALKKRSGFEYLKERFRKLLIPALFGLVLLVLPMTYITAIANGEAHGFANHFFGFWHVNPADLNGISGGFTPAHLWFLFFLFVFSIVGLPLFTAIGSKRIREGFVRIVDAIGVAGVAVALIVVSILVAKTNILGGINPIYYFTIFFTGYVFMLDSRFQMTIDKASPYLLVLAIVSEIARQFFFGDIYSLTHSGNLIFVIEQLDRWLWMLMFLGYGHRFLNRSGSVLKYLSSASFPFYIFHLLVNTAIGFLIIKSSMCIACKYLLIVVLTIVSTFVVYEIVRRIPVLRNVFGIRKR